MIPETIIVNVYYYIDDETGKPVFDVEEMEREFQTQIKELENYTGT